jgi:ribosomal protein L32
MFWELYQQSQIHGAKSDAARASGKASRVEDEVRRLGDRIDSLALICQAMWELIRERTTLSDQDIERRMEEIDLRDGKADGKMTSLPQNCSNCGRIVARRHSRCMYCGTEFAKEHLFE